MDFNSKFARNMEMPGLDLAFAHPPLGSHAINGPENLFGVNIGVFGLPKPEYSTRTWFEIRQSPSLRPLGYSKPHKIPCRSNISANMPPARISSRTVFSTLTLSNAFSTTRSTKAAGTITIPSWSPNTRSPRETEAPPISARDVRHHQLSTVFGVCRICTTCKNGKPQFANLTRIPDTAVG